MKLKFLTTFIASLLISTGSYATTTEKLNKVFTDTIAGSNDEIASRILERGCAFTIAYNELASDNIKNVANNLNQGIFFKSIYDATLPDTLSTVSARKKLGEFILLGNDGNALAGAVTCAAPDPWICNMNGLIPTQKGGTTNLMWTDATQQTTLPTSTATADTDYNGILCYDNGGFVKDCVTNTGGVNDELCYNVGTQSHNCLQDNPGNDFDAIPSGHSTLTQAVNIRQSINGQASPVDSIVFGSDLVMQPLVGGTTAVVAHYRLSFSVFPFSAGTINTTVDNASDISTDILDFATSCATLRQ